LQAAGICERPHELWLAELNAAHQFDWSRAVVDSVCARMGGQNIASTRRSLQSWEQARGYNDVAGIALFA
jgi:hypothetical protein